MQVLAPTRSDTQEKKRKEIQASDRGELTEMDPPTQSLQDLYIPRRTTPIIPIIPLLDLLVVRRRLNLDSLSDLGYNLFDIELQDPVVDIGGRVSG